MAVTRADVFILESYLRQLDQRMFAKLIMHQGQHNTPHDHPVQVQFGSNNFHVDRNELEPLVEAMEERLEADTAMTDKRFVHEVWWPFLRKFADR